MTTRAVIASAIGVALTPTQGSCLPLTCISWDSPEVSIVLPSLFMLEVGFKAIEVIINDPPVANAGPDQYASVGHEIAFDGTGSYDNDGKIIKYLWD